MRNLIVGAGLSGLTLAERLANVKGERVVVIDRRNHIGGNVYDYDEGGILVHKYGTHIFHTNDLRVWQYVNGFARFYPYMHQVKALIDGQFVPVPFNLNSLYMLFPTQMAQNIESSLLKHYQYGQKVSILELKKVKELAFLSEFIYEKVFLHYTLKQWQCTPEELSESVFKRVPIYVSKDNSYFQDRFQGIPLEGYSKMCQNMCASELIELELGCDFKDLESSFVKGFDRIFYSGGIDEYFDYALGELPYRSLEFDFVRFEREYFQSGAVINYPNNYDYTRIGEYKYFLDAKTPHTIVSFEYPKAWARGLERYYPVPNAHTSALYEAYTKKAREQDARVHFIGRLGEYAYYDMDKVIARALDIFAQL
ncbi:UDP-galactopyranose mutase [Helicobacter jaachi]|uniref:UDP-galactopyranose mutase n=1 Tax=Helicobacter jaachi TaxID=1677920 RepID=A0A4U8T965_9HELI|nr:UDP-galactopyranose mutase [Helicobacter jaachi]TLD96173.1 UDP-galactopyranose mutase [Helicobacter jaachi]